ncbi:hypothetical protein BHF72_0632 [Cloacibacterium normanense]|uniref:Uncharacterized protein n=1 Tax=Cloacibacterium normanense TaxID=237258 RepID=A0A1E5UBU3_9FLAO|nr:hypothetical protein BHF72_0632 [Cloacibacterium normanense]
MNFYDFRQQNYHFFLINHKEFLYYFCTFNKNRWQKIVSIVDKK